MDHFYKRWLVLCIAMLFMLAIAAPVQSDASSSKSGEKLLKGNNVTVDVSNAEKGYVLAKHSGSKYRLKIIISHDAGKSTYDLKSDGKYQTFPLSHGSGDYKIKVYEAQSTDPKEDMYDEIFSKKITVVMPTEYASFLNPNQYVWYTDSSSAAKKSRELCKGLSSDKEKVNTIYSYIRGRISYDYSKAGSVSSGYIPDVDKTLRDGSGICFDYAALFACMLRVQGIPTQLVIGDLIVSGSSTPHAWNKVRIGDSWILYDPTFARGQYSSSQYTQRHKY